MSNDRTIIFFDGKCPFCIGWVKFLLDRDGHDRFRFASLQSRWTEDFFESKEQAHPGSDSILVWTDGMLLEKSDAVAHIASKMGGIWKVFRVIGYLPKRFRDGAYDFVASRRYNWFEQREGCWLPTGTEKKKFLDMEDPIYKDN